jgi:ribonuclease HI
MIQYLEAVRATEKHFNGFSIEHIPRALNDKADKLAKAAARKQPFPPDVFYEAKERTFGTNKCNF